MVIYVYLLGTYCRSDPSIIPWLLRSLPQVPGPTCLKAPPLLLEMNDQVHLVSSRKNSRDNIQAQLFNTCTNAHAQQNGILL